MSRRGHEVKSEYASVDELKERYRGSKCAVERRRTQAVWLLLEGKSRKSVLEITAYSEDSLRKLVLSYNNQGLRALQDKRHHNIGAPTVLTDAELLLIARMLREDLKKGKVWRASEVLMFIENEFGKQLYLTRVYEILSAIGITKQTSRPRHVLANDEEQEAFKKSSAKWSRQLARIISMLSSGPKTNTVSG